MPRLLDMIEDAEHRDLLRWWLSARGGRIMPARSDFDPVEHPGLLPRLFLVSVSPRAPHFRYRLCGTEIDTQQGYAMTGRSFEEIFHGELYRFTLERFLDVAFNQRISYHTTHFSNSNTARRSRFTRLLLPLSGNGVRVDTILGSRIEVSDRRRSYHELVNDADVRGHYEVTVAEAAHAEASCARRLAP